MPCRQWQTATGLWITWHHAMQTLSALLYICEGNAPVTGGFPAKGPAAVFDVFFDVSLSKLLNKPPSFGVLDATTPIVTSLRRKKIFAWVLGGRLYLSYDIVNDKSVNLFVNLEIRYVITGNLTYMPPTIMPHGPWLHLCKSWIKIAIHLDTDKF